MDNVPMYEKRDFKNIGDFLLMTGPACNMFCRHCGQMPIKSCHVCQPKLNPKVYQLMEHFIEYALGREMPNNYSRHIFFYGGEALLYWDFIKDIIASLTEKYDITHKTGFRFGIQSNGLLLTEDKVEFLNKYGVEFGFSYDAPHPFAVRGYVSDEICDLVKKIDRHMVTSTGNAINYDYLLAVRCLRAKFPHAFRHRIVPNLTRSFDMPEDIYAYDWKKIGDAIRKLRIAAQLDDVFALKWFSTYVKILKGNHSIPANERVMSCMFRPTEFAFTPEGTFSLCHNSALFTGTVDDTWEVLKEKKKEFGEKNKSPECASCRHADICKVLCPLNLQNEKGGRVVCEGFQRPLFDIMKSEIMKFSEPLALTDLKWYHKEEERMEQEIQEFLLAGEKFKPRYQQC